MSTTTTKRPRRQFQRTMQFIATGMVNILWITQGRKVDGYMVKDMSAYLNGDGHERSYRLTKADGTQYDVFLDGPASLCDCKGFEHRGMQTKDGKGCKHVAALTKLHSMGRI